LKERKPERELPARWSGPRFVGIYVIQSGFLPQRKKEHEFEKARGSTVASQEIETTGFDPASQFLSNISRLA